MTATVEVRGLAELKRKFADISTALRRRVLQRALREGAKEVLKTARNAAPVLSPANAMHAPYRTPGTLRKAIRIRVSKASRKAGDVGVFVNVKPLKLGSAKNPKDPYYWRWVEFGHKTRGTQSSSRAIPGVGFMQAGAKRLPQSLQAFEKNIAEWINKTNQNGKIQP